MDWIAAAEAYALLLARNPSANPASALSRRAGVGLLRTAATLFLQEVPKGRGAKIDLATADGEIPSDFWRARGGVALLEDWDAGDFATLVDDKFIWRAFGVRFAASDVEAMLAPSLTEQLSPATEQVSEKRIGERRRVRPVATENEIREKMIQLWEGGLSRDEAAKRIGGLPGFEGVGNERAREAVAGHLTRGPRKVERES